MYIEFSVLSFFCIAVELRILINTEQVNNKKMQPWIAIMQTNNASLCYPYLQLLVQDLNTFLWVVYLCTCIWTNCLNIDWND